MFIINTDAGKPFGVKLIQAPEMATALRNWDNISSGSPPWLDRDDDIDTINFAKVIADYRARLTALDIGIAVSGEGPRAEYLQQITADLLKRMPDKLADADRLGGMIIKFNGVSWDFVMQGEFGVTALDGSSNIVGAIFASQATQGESKFTRLEYHRFEGDGESRAYVITNKAFKNVDNRGGAADLGREVPLATVAAWADFEPEVRIGGLEQPLFGFYRIPGANTIAPGMPHGMAVFANAITELKSLDIAISRKDGEVQDSKHITFVGQNAIRTATNTGIKLPRFVKGLGIGLNDSDVSAIHEHAPTLQTDARIKDINFDLSLIGVKCGFSEGVFVMDGQTGVITATQVESDDRDTIQTIKTDRDALQAAIEAAIAGADAVATLMGLAPVGSYELAFNFGDITYSYEEDKASWRYYVAQGWVPAWKYFVKFEKMTEEEAKQLVAEAAAANMQPGLFE